MPEKKQEIKKEEILEEFKELAETDEYNDKNKALIVGVFLNFLICMPKMYSEGINLKNFVNLRFQMMSICGKCRVIKEIRSI